MAYQKTKKLMDREDYTFGTPTQLDRPIRHHKKEKTEHPYGVQPGHHLLQINSNTWIEVKNDRDDEEARKTFIDKMVQGQQAFYNNLEIQMHKRTEM